MSGLGRQTRFGRLSLRFAQWGCANRPFLHLVVQKRNHPNRRYIDPIEQVGSFDPMVNAQNEKLCALNLERIQYYLAGGIHISKPVAQLLGLAGLLPQHPETYMMAWRNRKSLTDSSLRRDLIPEKNKEDAN